MEVLLFFTADFASADSSGKLNVMGIFTQINAPSLPVIIPQIHIVAQLEFDRSESGQHHIIFLRLYDPEEKELFTIPNEFVVPTSGYTAPVQVNVVNAIQRVLVETPGLYYVRLFAGDAHIKTIFIHVVAAAQPEPQGEG